MSRIDCQLARRSLFLSFSAALHWCRRRQRGRNQSSERALRDWEIENRFRDRFQSQRRVERERFRAPFCRETIWRGKASVWRRIRPKLQKLHTRRCNSSNRNVLDQQDVEHRRAKVRDSFARGRRKKYCNRTKKKPNRVRTVHTSMHIQTISF